MNFGDRLAATQRTLGPLCLGVDPSSALLQQWGLGDSPAGLQEFSSIVLEATLGVTSILKPQVAYYERHGSRGLAVLENLIGQARSQGRIVIADAKRGDIGTTAQAYGDAWVNPKSSLCADAVTLSPYLGLGALLPIVDAAMEYGNGVFVVAQSSNEEGASIQNAKQLSGITVAQAVLGQIKELNTTEISAKGSTYGSTGAVIGANANWGSLPLVDLGGPVLIPGFGAQGSVASALAEPAGLIAKEMLLANVSRDILAAGPDPQNILSRCSHWQMRFLEACP